LYLLIFKASRLQAIKPKNAIHFSDVSFIGLKPHLAR